MLLTATRALSAALVLTAAATVSDANEWRFNNGLPEGRGESKQLETFAADVAELTGGSVTIDVFHGGSLNLKDNDVARWLPRGAVEMGLVWANYLGRDVPALNAVMIQGSVGNNTTRMSRRRTSSHSGPSSGLAGPLCPAGVFCSGGGSGNTGVSSWPGGYPPRGPWLV